MVPWSLSPGNSGSNGITVGTLIKEKAVGEGESGVRTNKQFLEVKNFTVFVQICKAL